MPRTLNMTVGKPVPLIIKFAAPLLVSNVFQQLYTLADSFIVGRFLGVDAFAAVGASWFYYWLALSVVLGFSQGFSTLFAQRFGADDTEGLRRSVAHTVWLAALLAALMTALLLPMIRPVLVLMNTPAGLIAGACTYLNWLISSIILMFAYNVSTGVLISLGDSRTPLVAVICASVINVAMDVALVYAAGWGITGVAVATVFSQLCAFLYCLNKLRGLKIAVPCRRHFTFDKPTAGELLRLGIPLALRNAVIGCGGFFVQYMVNGFGRLFVAGFSAAGKYFGIMNLIGYALDGGVAVFTAQNYGARKFDRIKSGMRSALGIALVSSTVISALTIIFGRGMIALLIEAAPGELESVVETGYRSLTAYAVCFPALYLLFIHRSAIQGMGNSVLPMLSGFVELALRVCSVVVLPAYIGEWGVYFADGIGWVGAAVLLIVGYAAVFRKKYMENKVHL